MADFLISVGPDRAPQAETYYQVQGKDNLHSTGLLARSQRRGAVTVEYSKDVSVCVDESRDILFVLAGYFRLSGSQGGYSTIPEELMPLYSEKDRSFKRYLEGSFAIAAFEFTTGVLSLLTDRFGTHPLFYHHGGPRIIAGTRERLLMPLVPNTSISADALEDSFWLGFPRAPHSLVREISKIPDNSLFSLGTHGIVASFTHYPDVLSIAPDDTLEMEDVVEEMEAALDQEFQRISRGADKVAVLLSGGVDSSIMASLAKKHFKECVAFSCEIEGFDNPELERAKYVVGLLGIQHEIIKLERSQLTGIFNDVVSMLDGPSRHINNLVVRRIFQGIHDFDAIIGGDGADALFGKTTNRTIINLAEKKSVVDRIPAFLRKGIAFMLEKVNFSKRDQLINLLTQDLDWFICSLFTVDYAPEDLALAKKLNVGAFSKIPGDYYRSVDIVGKSMEANFTLFLNTMLVRNTRLSADSGIPVYYPFLSERMLKIARRLPFKLRFDQSGNAKPTLREICRRNLDSAVIEWPKIAFVTPENEWLRDDLRLYLEVLLSNAGGISRVLGVSFDETDREVIRKSARLGWWLMTLDLALLNIAGVVPGQNLGTYDEIN